MALLHKNAPNQTLSHLANSPQCEEDISVCGAAFWQWGGEYEPILAMVVWTLGENSFVTERFFFEKK